MTDDVSTHLSHERTGLSHQPTCPNSAPGSHTSVRICRTTEPT
jgi:hypothetical protein